MSHAHHRWHVVGPSLNGRIVRGGWSRFACRRRQSRPSHGGACARYLARERGRAGGALGEQEASAARSSARQRYYVTPVGVGAAGRGGPEAHEDRGALVGASGGWSASVAGTRPDAPTARGTGRECGGRGAPRLRSLEVRRPRGNSARSAATTSHIRSRVPRI